MTTLVWFRRDLRLHDNPALIEALKFQDPIIPVYIHCPKEVEKGACTHWWLHKSLQSLQNDLAALQIPFVVRRGQSSLSELQELIKVTKAKRVFWNRQYSSAERGRDEKVKKTLRAEGIEAESFNSHLLFEPWTIQSQSQRPYQVFSPFAKACEALDTPVPAEQKFSPRSHHFSTLKLKSAPLEELGLLPKIRWDQKLESHWDPSEAAALKLLKGFLQGPASTYHEQRDYPSVAATSQLSPYLRFGQISPRLLWKLTKASIKEKKSNAYRKNADWFLREILWREFAYHVLYHFPHTETKALRPEFDSFPWEPNAQHLKAWQRGETGIPIVDAGMRQLWETGWMHNRVRMIVASFLTKHLLMSWQEGAAWFLDTLVDADLASNTLGWQWAGGCGADAAPYFRIFNPVLQGEKFDTNGDYVKRWVPELSAVPAKFIHQPWNTKVNHYPRPLVDLKVGRERALQAFDKLRQHSPARQEKTPR
jgi:deoxyribodipyrimidine photo-lyase